MEKELVSYIRREFLDEEDAAGFETDSDLMGLLDSVQVLRLVNHVEEEYGVEIDDSEISIDNLGTPSRIATFVRSKRGE